MTTRHDLTEWVRHKDNCECVRSQVIYGVTLSEGGRCTCGLRAALAVAETPPPPDALRALEPFARIGALMMARPDKPDDESVVELRGINGQRGALLRGDFKAAYLATSAVPPPAPPALVALVQEYQRVFTDEARSGEPAAVHKLLLAEQALLAWTPDAAPAPEGAQDVEWWLGEQGIPGVPLALTDGPHSDRAGVERALYLIRALGLGRPGRRFVCVEAVVTEVVPNAEGVNHEAVAQNRSVMALAPPAAAPPQGSETKPFCGACGRTDTWAYCDERSCPVRAVPLREMQHAPRPDCDAEGWHLCVPPLAARPAVEGERIYPCDRCGKLRTKDEGGTTFTVCDACWDATAGRREGQ